MSYNIATYLLLAGATVTHLVTDLHKEKTATPIKHWLSAAIAVATSITFGYLNSSFTDTYWWQFAIYSLSIHFCFFDLVWNYFNGHGWFYNGDPKNPHRAWSDKIWDYIPTDAQPLLRLWVLGVGIGVYYHLDLIVGK